MSYNNIINIYNLIQENIRLLKEECKTYCQDKSFDLEYRWELFEKVGSLIGEKSCWSEDFESLPDEFIMYDGNYYHADRYQTVCITSIVENIQDGKDYPSDGYNSDKIISRYENIDLDKFKEEVLEKFIWSFVYDW